MQKYITAVEQMYVNKKNIIIGLTGRTGSGCSTVAGKILSVEDITNLHLKKPKQYDYNNSDERKKEIIYDYISYEDNWRSFEVIEGSAIILSFVFERGIDELEKYLRYNHENEICKLDNPDEIIKSIKSVNELFEQDKGLSLNASLEEIEKSKQDYYEYYVKKLSNYKKVISDILCQHVCYPRAKDGEKAQLYTYLMQVWANNIRSSGNPYVEKFTQRNFYDIAKRIDIIIKIIEIYKNALDVRVCIDALRNPYEVLYFKDKYKNFYLFSVSTENKYRKSRLSHLSENELEILDSIESPKKFENTEEQFYHQNINECVQISDVHIYNPNIENGMYYFLTEQVVKYISLILHPGLITPSSIERSMQLAYNAKFNSGCLSRQVGAVITGDDFSIRAVGWNDVPKGQVPCNLRSVTGYCENKDDESFSNFELCDPEFDCAMKLLRNTINEAGTQGRTYSYCFKDVYNGYKGTTNQVLTRALHAEENAFLQLSKYGGTGIKGGFLFTTASPCELCAKKAYQLGIKKIFYIDPYPGISMTHILKFGKEHNPELNLFYGAIGNAYIRLYEPRMSQKDELELVTGVEIKEELKKDNTLETEKLIASNLKYNEVELSLVYNSCMDIRSERRVNLEVTGEPINHLTKEIIWTGSKYIGSKLKDEKCEYTFKDSVRKTSPFEYNVIFNKNVMKGEKAEFTVETHVSDEDKQMKPYLAHTIKNPTNQLILRVDIPINMVEKVEFIECRDSGLEIPAGEPIEIKGKENDNRIIYEHQIKSPKLLNTYCLKWIWKKKG